MKSLKRLSPLKLQPKEEPLSEMELIAYGAKLCLHSMKILRGEIVVQSREAKLNALMLEADKVNSMLSNNHTYTQREAKQFFKDAKISPKHLEH